MRWIGKCVGFLLLVLAAYHVEVYLHEWTHGLVAWLGGYKSSPFDIHYGTRWITLWDISENINYSQITADGKAWLVALIAIAPMIMQMSLVVVGLCLLRKVQGLRYICLYLVTLMLLAGVYGYIPIRTFAHQDDIYNFITATGWSPWVVAIPGTLYVVWGLYALLSRAKLWLVVPTLIIFFGYYGGVGFTKPDPICHYLGMASWGLLVVGLGVWACLSYGRRG